MRRLVSVVLLVVPVLAAPAGALALPAPPKGWPSTFTVGLTSQPGTGAALGRRPGIGLRYQYLAGGVDTANWKTWNPNGTFVTRYVAESRAARLIPVFSYYTLLQSGSSTGSEPATDLAHLRNPALMRRYFADLSLALRRAGAAHRPVVLHVEPDLWGYGQQGRSDDARRTPAAVASSGLAALRGLPNTMAGFAQAILRLRARLAPSVLVAYHLSSWGVNRSITADDPSPARIDGYARRSAAFYRSLGARFDLVFTDVADRDEGFRENVLGDHSGGARWGPGDVSRELRYLSGFSRRTGKPLVIWQVPLGNPSLPNTWQRYRDNRVDLLLGSRANLLAERRAGVIGLAFGGGAEGCTTAQTDGGHFFALARAYARTPLALR